MKPAYIVSEYGHALTINGSKWLIERNDGDCTGVEFQSEEQAQQVADMMNIAFDSGRAMERKISWQAAKKSA